MYLFFSLTTWRGLDADWKEGGRSGSERERAARVDGEMAYLQKEKCGVKAVLFSLHSLDCSVVRKSCFFFSALRSTSLSVSAYLHYKLFSERFYSFISLLCQFVSVSIRSLLVFNRPSVSFIHGS